MSTSDTLNSQSLNPIVNPTTGVHTQNIESYWNRVKTKFKRMKGVQTTMLGSYMDEYMWRERHRQTDSIAMRNLFRDIAQHYPVWKRDTLPPFILFSFVFVLWQYYENKTEKDERWKGVSFSHWVTLSNVPEEIPHYYHNIVSTLDPSVFFSCI